METKPLQTRAVHRFGDLRIGVAAADTAVYAEICESPGIEQRCIGGVCGDRLGVEVDRGQDAVLYLLADAHPAGVGVEGEDRDVLAGDLYIRLQFDVIRWEARNSGNQEGPTVEAPIADARQLGARLLSRDDNLLRLLDDEAGGIGALRCG